MDKLYAIAQIEPVLSGKLATPAITLWNRLEGQPRTDDFDRALKAEIRDPLWMLTKQWQMGEFEGDDAGSPISAKLHMATTELTRYSAAGHSPQRLAADLPLEARVEQLSIPFAAGGLPRSFDIRLLLGRRWLKLIAGIEPGLAEKFIDAYRVEAPDPTDKAAAALCAHTEVWQQLAALAGRAMDGWALYAHLKAANTNRASDGIALTDPANAAMIDAKAQPFIDWYEALFLQPQDRDEKAWLPERMEYAFTVQAPRDGAALKLSAEAYHHGHLDWYNFEIDVGGVPLPAPADEPLGLIVEQEESRGFAPTAISFDGMPNTRWWTFEEGRTNFGDIDPEKPDLNKLMLMEFGLVYANDWFLLPLTVPAGSVSLVKGLAVTNVFGERTWIEPAGRGEDDDWQRWAMFGLSTSGHDHRQADLSLFMVPSVAKIQQGEALEEIELVRDEVANMVWGIETSIPLATGEHKSGRSAAFETRNFHLGLIPPPPALPGSIAVNNATVRYQLMTSVPENWIPLIPVHVPGDNREIQLRRAALPRILDFDPAPPERIRPRTALLREGLDHPNPQSLSIHEEEVPREGVHVSLSFQRTRCHDGRPVVWLGARKAIARGERSSGLQFDQVVPVASGRV
jgi:hypothetical protein